MTNFKWIGPAVDCYNPVLEGECFEFYKSFIYNNEEYHVGEFALFNECNGSKIPRIGKLLCLYSSGEESRYKGLVQWHSWASSVNRQQNPTNIKLDTRNEIIEDEMENMLVSNSVVSLEGIQKKCQVIYTAASDPANLAKLRNLYPNASFFCRYRIKDKELTPVLTKELLGDDYVLANELYHKLDITDSENGMTSLTYSSPWPKTSPKHKRGSNCLKTPIANLDSEGSDVDVEVNKIKSSLSLNKSLKLTPKNERYSLSLNRNSSVKRVLNDSFGDTPISPSGIPILSYSVIDSTLADDDKSIKMKFKLTETENSTNLKVHPTKLDKEVVRMKSPIKLNHLTEINNRIEVSSKLNNETLDVPHTLINSPQVSLRARTQTPAKIDSTKRRSSRTVERVSYAEYLSPEKSMPMKRTYKSNTNKTPLREVKICLTNIMEDDNLTTASTVIATPRAKRSIIRPKKYEDSIFSSPRTPTSKKTGRISDEEDESTLKSPESSRPKRNTSRPRKYTDDANDSSPLFSPNKLAQKLSNISNTATSLSSQLSKSTNRSKRKVNTPKMNTGDVDNNMLNNTPRRSKRQLSVDSDDSSKTINDTPRRTKLQLNDSNHNSKTPNNTPRRSKRQLSVDDSDDNSKTPNNTPRRSKRQLNVDDSDDNSKTPNHTPRRSNKKLSTADNNNTDKKSNLRRNALMNSCKKLAYADSDDDDNDNEVNTLKTPRRGKAKISSTPKSTPGSKARMIREGALTPSVQAREIALVKDNTPLSKARTQLHVSYVPDSLPCREKEFTDVMNFLEGKLLDGCGGCMYISGVPGTGKTATVTEAIRNLQKAARKRKVPTFTYINVNGMKLSEPRQAYVEIMKQLTGKTVHWEQAQTLLESQFVKSQKKTSPIILIVDELDILCTKRQDVVYNLLDWPTKVNTQLIVVTIANTMDLPERLLMGRVTSRLGLTRLPFQPYTHKQLQEIVQKRLSGISAFNPDAIQLVARKVASVSGDARRALDICRRAVEIAEIEGKHNLVSLTHVNQALNAMITQPKVRAIKSCSKLEKLILKAVVAEVERTGVEETNFANVFKMLVTLAALDGFKMVSTTITLATVTRLGLCRLLLIDQKCSNIHQKIILNVSVDDVYYALTKTDI